ncbi:hypothetical protein ABZY57_26145 [Streptomyces sp. NPDC006450]|uniref:hypothetical protein n=1 Tax=Streptomyces sp. NPDC006450 TaxID=3155458 RepID=UPI0033ACCA48
MRRPTAGQPLDHLVQPRRRRRLPDLGLVGAGAAETHVLLDPYRDDLDPSQVPHLAAIGVRWAAPAARDIYPQGLRTFVDGLLARAVPRSGV